MNDLARRLLEWLTHPRAPLAVGIATAFIVAWFWGGLGIPGAYHDERSYVVQARVFASLAWTWPSPPLPLFWEMAHVFVEPRIFSKYPPGHALLLTPGIALGLPGLVPVLLAGVAGGTGFWLARRIGGPWVATGAWLLWVTVPKTLDWHASYFSESSSVALWLVALAAFVSWRFCERPATLVLLTAAVAWMGITRPVTALALGIPLAVGVVRTSWRRKSWRGWAGSALVGAAIVAIVPVWGQRSLGSVSPLPYAEYSRWYFPFDLPGFDRDTSPPRRQLPADLEQLAASARSLYAGHEASRMPRNFVERSVRLAKASMGDVAFPLAGLVPVGLVALGTAGAALVAGSMALHLGAYLSMPHNPAWTLYYLELTPVVVFLAVLGLAQLLRWGLARRSRFGPVTPREVGIAVALLAVLSATGLPDVRRGKLSRTAKERLLDLMLAELPEQRVVVFVRRTRPVSAHLALWDIRGDPQRTDVWIVRDLGDAANAQLVARAEGRAPYLLDEITMTLTRVNAPAGAP